MSDDAERIEGFWHWFATGPGRWTSPDDNFDMQALPLLDELATRFPELVTPIRWIPSLGLFEIQFSTRRQRAVAPLVRALVAAAPDFEHWRFKAFQAPARNLVDVWVASTGVPFDLLPYDAVRVEVLERGPPCAIRVFVPSFAPELGDEFAAAVDRLLEQLLGEAWLLEEVARVEIADVLAAPVDAVPITRLGQIVGADA